MSACSDEPAATLDSTSTDSAAVDTAPEPTPGTDSGATSVPTPITVPITGDVTVPIDSVAPPPRGVPEVDAPDAVCRGLARVGGTSSLIGVAASFDGADPWRLEVISTPLVFDALAAAAEGADDVAPADSAALRTTFIDPQIARGQVVIAALESAGARAADLDELRRLWLEVLRTDDQLDPAVAVPGLPRRLDTLVVEATVVAAAQLGSTLGDAALGTVEPMPSIDRHLAETCPTVLAFIAPDAV